MIAVCPTCHDAIHHGTLPLDDQTLYSWKQIPRTGAEKRDHIYVEPGPCPRILVGSVSLTGQEGVALFRLGASQELSFRTSQADLVLLQLRLLDLQGIEVLRIADNYVVHKPRPEIEYKSVPGWVEVTAPAFPFVPDWAVAQMRSHEPQFASDGRIIVASVRVLEPGLVRVQGVWMDDDKGVIVTNESLSFLRKGSQAPISLRGAAGGSSVLSYDGPITASLFGFGR